MQTRTVETGEPKPAPPDRQAARKMVTGDAAYATVLLVWAVDAFGFDEDTGRPNVFDWSPATIRREIKDETGAWPSQSAMNRLMAAIAIVTTDGFFKDVRSFIHLANVLAGDDCDPEVFDPADSVECAWAVTEGLILWPPDEDEKATYFCDDIRHYIGHVLKEEGYVTAPDILRIAIGADASGRVAGEFSDDPEMFQAITARQTEKAEEVSRAISEGLGEMLAQLKALRLRHGSTDEIEQKIVQALRASGPRQGERP